MLLSTWDSAAKLTTTVGLYFLKISSSFFLLQISCFKK